MISATLEPSHASVYIFTKLFFFFLAFLFTLPPSPLPVFSETGSQLVQAGLELPE